jgi:hypothetical protein
MHAGAGQESLADILDFLDELPFIDINRFILPYDDPAIDDDGVHAAAIGVIDQGVHRIEEITPFWTLGVEQYEIGLLPHLDRAQVLI